MNAFEREREVQALANEYIDDLGYTLGQALQLAQQTVDGLMVEAAGYNVQVELAKAKGRTTNGNRRPTTRRKRGH